MTVTGELGSFQRSSTLTQAAGTDLNGRQPQGEGSGIVLQQDAEEALDGAEDCAVQHDGLPLLLVSVRVLLQQLTGSAHSLSQSLS